MTNEFSSVANASASIDTISIDANSARVTVKYGDVDEIVVKSNNPEEFKITTGDNSLTITENAASGIFGSSSSNGGIIVGNCSVVCTGSITGLSQSIRNGQHIVKINGLTITSSRGANIRVDGNSLTINNRTIPMPPSGSTIRVDSDALYVNGEKLGDESNSNASKPLERSELLITVPNACKSKLRFRGSGDATLSLAKWTGSKLTLETSGQSKATVGTVDVPVLAQSVSGQSHCFIERLSSPHTIICASGQATAKVRVLYTSTFQAHASGQATVKVAQGRAESTFASASGQSDIRLIGQFENVTRQKSGQSDIYIG